MEVTYKDTEICMCECHKVGSNIMHFVDCCQLCYEKYINKDGEVDDILLAKAFGNLRKNGKKVKTKDIKVVNTNEKEMIEIDFEGLIEEDHYKQYVLNLSLIGNPGFDMMHNHDGNYGMALDTNFYLHFHKDKFGNFTGRPIKLNPITLDHIHGKGSTQKEES